MESRDRRSGRALRAVTGLLLGSSILASGAAFAQEAVDDSAAPTASSSQNNTILVTSQRRVEDLQDVPISVQVLNTERLENLQVDGLEDYVKFLPSVSTQNYGGPFYQLVYMRGVASGGDGNHSGPLPSVGTYLDEQPITTAQGNLNVHLYDVARVEALAGPQGTLFGASSQAGTIRIITNQPDASGFDMGFDVEGNYVDHGEFGGALEGFVNMPISDTIAARLVGWYVKDGGYIDNIRGVRTFPSSGETDDNLALVEDDFNDVETYGARLALGIELDDNWTVTPSIMAQKQNTSGTFAFLPSLGDLNVQTYRDNFQDDEWVQAAMTVEGRIGNFDLVYSGAYLERGIDGLADYSDYAYFYDVLYGYGYYFVADCPAQDFSCPLVNPSQYFSSRDRFNKVSQELRLSSPQDESVRFQAGLFYQRQEHDIQQRYQIDNIASFIEVPGWSDTIWLTKQTRIDRDYAAFGEVAIDLTDQLTVTGGLRYFEYNNTLIGFFGYSENFSGSTGVAACRSPIDDSLSPPSTDGAPCTNLAVTDADGNVIVNPDGTVSPRRSKNDGLIHRLNVTYNFTPDVMAYATWSRGFRPGGTNRRGGLFGYQADFLTNYELGLKTSFADGLVRWNAAIFQLDWDKFQFAILGPNGLTEIRNAAQARIRGFETDVTLQPADGLTLAAGMTYLDAKLTDNYCGFTDANGDPVTVCANPPAPAGTRLPASPKFKGNVTARYEWFLNRDLLAHVQFAGVLQSDIRSNLLLEDNRLVGTQDGYGTVDLAVGVKKDLGGWNAEFYVTNVFDERGQAYLYAQCGSSVCANDVPGIGGNVYQVPNQPRTFGLRFGYSY
ncbi:TonB-dependent receptor [Altererythrobacter aestuarii]|uniref:TonB-dependent receptor n=2 Tax=Alteraurantiacibacter aestuarii TaxID=650004 RepID=A0A844ZLZ3_9SPHN|nr:TonB-dependent receptor [Alteraurantiacibacter aestuarii]